MATLRTEEEKAEIVRHCVELEQSGGDILAYLWSQNYISPRATWCNFQREWLGRKPYEYTDGKPGKGKVMGKKVMLTDEQKAKAVRIAIDGGDPRAYLATFGMSDASLTWQKIKNMYKDRHPEIWAKIPKRIPNGGLKNRVKAEEPKEEQLPTVKLSGPIVIETKEPEKVEVVEPEISLADAMNGIKDAADTFFGECEKMGLKVNEPKITQPVSYDGMVIREVEGLFGRYRRSDISGKIYIDFEPAESLDVLSYTVEQWKTFRKEQEKAVAVLGVEL